MNAGLQGSCRGCSRPCRELQASGLTLVALPWLAGSRHFETFVENPEPELIVARLVDDPAEIEAMRQRLQKVVVIAEWRAIKCAGVSRATSSGPAAPLSNRRGSRLANRVR